MSTTHRVEIQVGIAVLLAILILVVGLLWFQEYTYRAQHAEVHARFITVGGLAKGDAVMVRGVPLGKVESVALTDDCVDVAVEIDASVKLTDKARFEVQALGLAGERGLSIDPGDGAVVDPAKFVFQGIYAPGLTEMSGQFQDLNTQVTTVLRRVDRLLAQVEDAGGVGDAVRNSTRAAGSLADLLERNGDAFSRAAHSMAHLSTQLDSLVAGPGKRIANGAAHLADLSARVDTLLSDMGVAADAAADILTAIRTQKGSVGRAVYSDSLMVETEGAIRDVRALIAEIRRNPERYLNVTLMRF